MIEENEPTLSQSERAGCVQSAVIKCAADRNMTETSTLQDHMSINLLFMRIKRGQSVAYTVLYR